MRLAYVAAAAALTTLTSCGAGAIAHTPAPAPANAHQVIIWEYKFQPNAVTVPAGTIVTWVNRDMTVHTATHYSYTDEPFDSGDMTAQGTFSHTFRTPGTYSYLCMLHQGMVGTVVVEAAPTSSNRDSQSAH